MAYMVTGRYRVRQGQEARFVAQMELLEDMLRREARGLQYWALARSLQEPGIFNSVAIWASPDDERRMADHPIRQALLPNLQKLLAEPPSGIGGTIALEIDRGPGTGGALTTRERREFRHPFGIPRAVPGCATLC